MRSKIQGAASARTSHHKLTRMSTDDRGRLPRIREKGPTAIIDGTSYTPNSWNSKAFMVTPYEWRYDIEASFRATLIFHPRPDTFRFEAKAKAVRRDERLKQLAAIFTGLDTETTERLLKLAAAKHYDSRGRAI